MSPTSRPADTVRGEILKLVTSSYRLSRLSAVSETDSSEFRRNMALFPARSQNAGNVWETTIVHGQTPHWAITPLGLAPVGLKQVVLAVLAADFEAMYK